MIRLAAAGTVDSILKVLLSSLTATAVIVTAFSLTILGSIRAAEMRRAERSGPAAAYSTLAVVGAVVFTTAVVYGLILLTRKS